MTPLFFPVWLSGGAWIVFGSIPAADPADFAPMLIPSPEPHHHMTAGAVGVAVPPGMLGHVGQRFVLQRPVPTAAGAPCIATVTGVRIAAVVDTMEGFDPEATPENPIAHQLLAYTTRRHVLGDVALTGDCAAFTSPNESSLETWARPEGAAAVTMAEPRSVDAGESAAEKALVARATAELRKLPLWAPIQAEWAKLEDAKDHPKWDDGVGIDLRTVQAAGHTWVYLSASASCSFGEAAWALWEVGAGDTWKLRTDPLHPAPLPTFGRAADLDGDGLIELLSPQGITSGKAGVWTRVLDTEVDWIGCAC